MIHKLGHLHLAMTKVSFQKRPIGFDTTQVFGFQLVYIDDTFQFQIEYLLVLLHQVEGQHIRWMQHLGPFSNVWGHCMCMHLAGAVKIENNVCVWHSLPALKITAA